MGEKEKGLDVSLAHDLDVLDRAGLRRSCRPVSARHGAHVVVDGHPAIDFASNDYLGLAADPRLAHAIATSLDTGPTGAAAARLISGTDPQHLALEHAVANHKHTEAALLFGSGYLANIGTIPALVGPRDVIYADALNHASLIDGCRLSRAELRTFPHRDLAALSAMLSADDGRFRRRLIVVDAVFSMDGDLFPLDQLVEIAHAHHAWTYVDDAHGTGVLGATGRGSAEHWSVEGKIDVLMGTLGKALGTSGAFIAGSRTLIDYLTNRARSFVYTTAAPPALAAAATTALAIAESEPHRRDHLRAVARRLRDGLRAFGREPLGEPDGHIIPVVLGDAALAVETGAALRARGFLVGAVRPPTVPLGTARLRITTSAAHTFADVDALLAALSDVLPHSAPSDALRPSAPSDVQRLSAPSDVPRPSDPSDALRPDPERVS